MQRVGHHDAVQVRQVQRPREIRQSDVNRQLRVSLGEAPALAGDRARVAVDRPDPGAVIEESGQRQREVAVP
jgi:hypothetical protein